MLQIIHDIIEWVSERLEWSSPSDYPPRDEHVDCPFSDDDRDYFD